MRQLILQILIIQIVLSQCRLGGVHHYSSSSASSLTNETLSIDESNTLYEENTKEMSENNFINFKPLNYSRVSLVQNQNQRREKEKVREGHENTNNIPEMKPHLIVGGVDVVKAEFQRDFKFVCGIIKEIEFNGETIMEHTCGCTLIAPNVALTAAHCQPNADKIQLGKLYLRDEDNDREQLQVETFTISEMRTHSEWNRDSFSNDIMLVKFKGSSSMPVVKLKVSPRTIDNNVALTVIGWGVQSAESKAHSNQLQKVRINYLDKESCREDYGDAVDDTMFCAYKEGADACQGDSGGPILRRSTITNEYVQLGIVSWGVLCGVYPGVYTNLNIYKKFIHDTVCNPETGYSKSSCTLNGSLPNFL